MFEKLFNQNKMNCIFFFSGASFQVGCGTPFLLCLETQTLKLGWNGVLILWPFGKVAEKDSQRSLRRFVRRMKGHCIGNHVAEQRSGTQGLPQLFSVAVINIMTESDSGEKIIYFSLQATVHHSEKPG